MKLYRLIGPSSGTDECNFDCVAYHRHDDGYFHVPRDAAISLTTGIAGFVLADPGDSFWPDPDAAPAPVASPPALPTLTIPGA